MTKAKARARAKARAANKTAKGDTKDPTPEAKPRPGRDDGKTNAMRATAAGSNFAASTGNMRGSARSR